MTQDAAPARRQPADAARSTRRSSCSSSMARSARDGSRYRRTANPWQQDEARIERVMAARRVRARPDAGVHAPRRLPDGVPGRPARRPGRRAVRPVRERRRRGLPRDVDPGSRPRPRCRSCAATSGPIAPRKLWPTDAVRRPVGQDRAAERDRLRAVRLRRRGVGSRVQRGKYGRRAVQRGARGRPPRGRSATAGARTPEPDLGHRSCRPTAQPGFVEAFARALAAEARPAVSSSA